MRGYARDAVMKASSLRPEAPQSGIGLPACPAAASQKSARYALAHSTPACSYVAEGYVPATAMMSQIHS